MAHYDKILLNGDTEGLSEHEKFLLFGAAMKDLMSEDRFGNHILRKYIRGFREMIKFYEEREEYENCHMLKTLINEL